MIDPEAGRCPYCHHLNTPAATTCTMCGFPLSSVETPVAAPRAAPRARRRGPRSRAHPQDQPGLPSGKTSGRPLVDRVRSRLAGLDKETLSLVDALTVLRGCSRTEVLEAAVREMAERVGVEIPPTEIPPTEIPRTKPR